MANKTQVATVGEQQAAVVINNQFIDGLTKQLEEKCKYGLSFPKDYNLSNALMGAYLVLKETKDRNNKPILESCSQISIAKSNKYVHQANEGKPTIGTLARQLYNECQIKLCEHEVEILRKYSLFEEGDPYD